MEVTKADFINPSTNPVTLPCNGQRGRFVRVTAKKLWQRAENFAFCLAELQAYVDGKNIALGKPVSILDEYPTKSGKSGYLLKTSTTAEIATAVSEVHCGGSPMTPRIARRVLEMFAKANSPKRDFGLSPREQQILQLLVDGKTVKEAAADIGISFHTADEYIRSVYGKLQVHTRGGAVAKAQKDGLV